MAEGIALGGRVQDTRRVTGSTFERPPEIPWSELGHEFIETWGHDAQGRPRAEHLEVMGQSGSGKTYAIATVLQQRARRWDSAEIAVLTKSADDSIPLLGWPVVDDFAGLKRYRQLTFWPQTSLQGEDREAFHEARLYELLSRLWRPGANCVLYLDEVRYIESLSRRVRKLVRMYWREGRSHGISIIAGAQRPLEMVRDQHSESRWKFVFPPADEGDMDRFAEMLGLRRDWAPVLRSLEQTEHQFVVRNSFTKDAYITQIDQELKPDPAQSGQREDNTPAGAAYGSRRETAA